MKRKEIEELTCSEVINLKNNKNEYLILQGCGGDLNEWVEGITNMFKEEDIEEFIERKKEQSNNVISKTIANWRNNE